MKTIEQNFIDWESSAFGFGYGTGEPVLLPIVRQFFENCDDEHGSYKYDELEKIIGPSETWFLINLFGRQAIIEYGTSPRYGWLTPEGKALRKFILSKTSAELIHLVCNVTEDDIICYRDACNCGENGYREGVKCPNPFWSGHS